MILLRFYVFPAASPKWSEHFDIKKGATESQLPEFVRPDIQSCIIFGTRCFIWKGFTLKRLKICLDRNIKTSVNNKPGSKRRESLLEAFRRCHDISSYWIYNLLQFRPSLICADPNLL